MALGRLLASGLLLLLAPPPCNGRWRGKGGGRGGQWMRAPRSPSAPAPPATHDFDSSDCPKCMAVVMRLLQPGPRGCPAANATIVRSSNAGRVPTAYCDTLLPKKRACIAYSFGLEGTWDFDKVRTRAQRTSTPAARRALIIGLARANSQAMVSKGCRVLSFDPLCCGGAHRMGPSHDFIPVGLHTYDGLVDSDDPARPNTTFPVLSLRTIMTSYEHPRIDVLRLKVGA